MSSIKREIRHVHVVQKRAEKCTEKRGARGIVFLTSRRWILKSLFLENDASFRERGSYTEVIVVAKSLSPTLSCSTEKVAFMT